MMDVKATIAALRASGIPAEIIGTVLECYQELAPHVPAVSSGRHPAENRIERLREYDRNRKRKKKEEDARKATLVPAENSTEQKGGDIEIIPISKPLEEGKEFMNARATPAPSRWPEFKNAFPKRAGDYDWKKAEAKFSKHAAKGVPEETMIDGARRYAAFCDAEGKTGTQYVRQPTTWLNNEGWKNDYTPSRKTGINTHFDDIRAGLERYRDPDDGTEGVEPLDETGLPF